MKSYKIVKRNQRNQKKKRPPRTNAIIIKVTNMVDILKIFLLFIYVAVPDLSCGMRDLVS